ncbi:MAG TPA: RDD family protein [Myxococcales bacterium]|jgi:uncharacterized RDD family membrane protein YckC|nr:RDD family protein [Myxococcales bacterium]
MNCTNHPEVISGVVACGRCGKPFCQDCVIELAGLPYDAACKEEQIRDLRSGAAEFSYANSMRRWAALMIDSMIIWIFAVIINAAFMMSQLNRFRPGHAPNGAAGLGFGEIIVLMQVVLPITVLFLYEGLMTQGGGQTLGKRALGIRVVNADGSPMQGGASWKRAGARAFVTVTIVLNLVDAVMVFSEKHLTLRDRFAGTVVVRRSA